MDFSDDEEELLPESASNYYFVDEKEEPISFCVLPYRWQEGQDVTASTKQVFLHGVGDDGLQKIYKQVTEWKFELEGIRPVIYVFSKDQKWLQLSKPRKSYQDMIRKILITIQCLHYVRSNPEESEKSLWAYLRKEFSYFESRPSPVDLQDHLPFIREMMERDDTFSKCQLLPKLIDGTSRKTPGNNEDVLEAKNTDFINDEDDEEDNDGATGKEDANDSDEEQDCFDSACALCDNGGDLICCEGRCLRSFHAFKDADPDSDCKTLGYTKSQIKAIKNFLCPNCRYKRHQCYACGKLGSSDKAAGAEVFPCVSATCGHFYHPKCVAKLLHPTNETDSIEQEKKIAAGETFICPVHKCLVCKQGENKEVEELQFAVCRRCPTSYHRKCLPSEINFEESDEDSDEDEESDIEVRAWNNLLPNRILIYCMKHKIDPDLGTPLRNHLKFPDDPEVAERKKAQLLLLNKTKAAAKKTDLDLSEDRPPLKKAKLVPKSSLAEENGITTKRLKTLIVKKEVDSSRVKAKGAGIREIEPSKQNKSLLRDLLAAKADSASPSTTAKKLISLPEVDKETEKRVIALARRSPLSSLTLDNFIKQKDIPSTHAYAARHIDKTVTLGKVEGSIEAIQTALQKVTEDDGNTDNAKTVCEPGIVVQISKWKNRLAVYLSPFLHGLLYTPFGRHFTKVDKLKEIVERLHWYVQSGDMIVDFCCGANDFSTLMSEKLEATGKKCFYRNYDIIAPKNDFNFIRRDWMKVRQQDLPPGSQLIMGLNPPFGVKGALANKFIDKALEFRPKLVVLIVPKETERLDVKRGTAYNLIWEDDQKLSGKAFYMPGNVDVNDKLLEQWNVSPPPLYLWSRPDWTGKHMEIAKRQGHVSSNFKQSAASSGTPANETKIPSPVREEKPVQAVEAEKSVPLKPNKKEHSKQSVPVEKKDPGSSAKNRKRKQSDNKKDMTPASIEDGESDMSISPRQKENKGTPDALVIEEHPADRINSSSSQPVTDYDRILGTSLPSERFNMKEDSRQHTSLEADYLVGNSYNRDAHIGEPLYGSRSSSYGLLDRPVDNIRADLRLFGQPRSADLASDVRSFASPTTAYGTSVSGLGLSGLSSASYGYNDSALRSSSVTDRYASRMSPGLPGSSLGTSTLGTSTLGTSTIDKYAPRLESLTYARRNTSSTPESSLHGRESIYGTPGYPRDPQAFPPGSRYSSSGWLND